MKKFLVVTGLWLAYASVVVLSGCHKEPESPSDKFVGKWYVSNLNKIWTVDNVPIQTYLINQGYSTSDVDQFISDLAHTTVGPFGVNSGLELKKDHTYFYNSPGGSVTGPWELSDDAKTITFDKDKSYATIFQIESVTTNQLVLSVQFAAHYIQNSSGIGASVDCKNEYTFTKSS